MKTLIMAMCLGLSTALYAQIPSLSPRSYLEHVIGNTTITVEFERPASRGRQVFGGLVPWNEVWRTGAGYCTKLGFDKVVTIGGQSVVAGKYALLSIPGETEWTIILNRDTLLYGSRDYDPAKDVARFKVPAGRAGRFHEGLSLELDYVPDNAELYISWSDVQVHFPIVTSTEATLTDYFDDLLRQPLDPEADYGYAAEYLFYQRADFGKAIALADRQLAVAVTEYPLRVKFDVYAYLGYRAQALEMVRQAREFLKTKPYDEQNMAWSLREWEKMEARVKRMED